MRLGLFGGTFDPIHLGHLDVARAARRALQLDCVWLVPSRLPPHRAAPHASAAHRFAMVALAADGQDGNGLLVSDLEMDAPGPSYTSDTLDRLLALGLEASAIFFVTGADAFRDIAMWKNYPAILDRCHFIVVSRAGTTASDLPRLLPSLAHRMAKTASGLPERPTVFLVDAPTAPVSSTDVRRAIADGRAVDGLVPAAVAGYLGRHRLYAAPSPGHEGRQGLSA